MELDQNPAGELEGANIEHIQAVQAINFISNYHFPWLINTNFPVNYNVDDMVTMAKEMAGERGMKLIMKDTLVPGYIELVAEEGWTDEAEGAGRACQTDRAAEANQSRGIIDAAS